MTREERDKLLELPVDERLDLIDALWESIEATGEPLPMPESHLRELDRRRTAQRENPEPLRPWEEVRERLWAEVDAKARSTSRR